MEKFLGIFVTGGSTTLVIMIASVLLLFVVLLLYTPLLSRVIFPAFGYRKYSDYLPFKGTMKDGVTVRLDSGAVVRAFSLKGVQTSMQDDEAKKKFLDLRAQLFNQVRDPDAVFRFITVRDFIDNKTEYEFDHNVLQDIYNKWNDQGLKIFRNKYFLILSVSSGNMEKMTQYSNLVENILAPYGVEECKHNSLNNMATLFGRILSPVSKPVIRAADNAMSELATVDNVDFVNGGIIKYSSGDSNLYSAMLSLKAAPDFMDEDFFDEISTIQTEIIQTNIFRSLGQTGTEQVIRQRQSTADSSVENVAVTTEQIEDAMMAMDENITGTQNMVSYYPLVSIFAKSIEELNDYVSDFKKICARFGVSPMVEDFASKVSFFAQIPGFDTFPRSFKLLSKTAAISIPMSSVPSGHENSDWGPGPIVVFPTAQGTPYRFQFHVSDAQGAVAHTLTIGPTGGGKTTLFSFLISQSLRFPKLKAFFFDRNRGAEIFTLATGGNYMTLRGKSNSNDFAAGFETQLNPLKMEDSVDNRAFLRRWLSMISGVADPKSLDEIARAVSINFDYVDEKNRKLTNIIDSCFSSDGAMRPALKKWVDPLQYGNIFNEDKDTLNLYSRLTTFDFTDILLDEVLAPAVISYIIHRINSITISNGTPSLIMIDETAPMLKNKMFRENFIVGLQEGRKNRQAYMAAFQQANIIDTLGIGDVVRGQAQTVIFFRNPGANASDYEQWKLNPLEMAFIQGKAYPALKRAVLLSRPVIGESVVLNTELDGLGNMLRLFESGRQSVLLAEELYKQYGNKFVAEYLKKVETKDI